MEKSPIFKARIGVTITVTVVQSAMALLAMFDRLNSDEMISRYPFFNLLVDDNYWGGVFTVSAIVCLLGFKYYSLHSISMSISSSLLLVWGLLTLGDILTIGREGIPLIGAVLSLAMGVVAYFMSQVWNTITWETKIKTLATEVPLKSRVE